MWHTYRMKDNDHQVDGTASRPLPLTLDVRPIFNRGETPCHAIDEAISRLGPAQTLVILAPFEPVPLYTKLTNLGYGHRSQPEPDGTWRIEFRPESTRPAVAQPVPRCACSEPIA